MTGTSQYAPGDRVEVAVWENRPPPLHRSQHRVWRAGVVKYADRCEVHITMDHNAITVPIRKSDAEDRIRSEGAGDE